MKFVRVEWNWGRGQTGASSPWEDFTSLCLGLEEIGVGGSMESQSHLNQTDRSLLHPDDFRWAPPCSNGIRLTEPDMLARWLVCRENHGSA